jgi:multiple sugar transport system permease protein
MRTSSRESLAFYAFISPWLLGFFALTALPLLFSFVTSLTLWNGIGLPRFVGLRNMIYMLFVDDRFWKAVVNTLYYTFAAVPLQLALALLLATLLNKRLPGKNVFRSIFFLPSIVSGVSVFLVWAWMFDNKVGLFNFLLSRIGVGPVQWLLDERWAMPSLILMALTTCGGSMLIFLAALQAVPGEYLEAATIDGASPMVKFMRITLPILSPSIYLNAITGVIAGFQVFSQPFIMTGGGPYYSTYTLGLHIYKSAFQYSEFGYAAALSWFLFLLILAITGALIGGSSRLIHYEGAR